MADMTLKWEAHDKNVVAELEKMNKAMEQLKETNKKLSEESKEHHQATHGFMQEQVHEISGMVTGYLTMGTAIEGLKAGYDGWLEKLKETGREHAQFTKDLLRDIAAAGDATQSDRIEEWAKHGAGTPDQMRQAYRGVRGANPGLPLDQTLDIAGQVAIQAPTQIDMSTAGGAAGTLKRFAPDKSAGDIADLSVFFRDKLQGGEAKLLDDSFMRNVSKLTDSGAMTFEEAMGLGASAVSKNQKLGFIGKLAELATASNEDLTGDLKPGEAPTPDQNRRSMLADMKDPRKRIEAVFGDHQMAVAGFGKDAAFELSRNSLSEIDEWVQGERGAMSQNIGARMVGGHTKLGILAQIRQAGAQAKAGTESENEDVWQEVFNYTRQKAWNQGGGKYAQAVMAEGMGNAFPSGRGSPTDFLKLQEQQGVIGKGEADAIIGLIEALHRTANVVEESTRSRGGTNVDAHTE